MSVVGPLVVELGAYELEEPEGTLRETGRAQEEILVPLAHTEGGLSASISRGTKAAADVGRLPNICAARQNDACILLCLQGHRGRCQLAKWLEASLDDLRAFLAALDDPTLSKRAKLREVKTHVVGPMCHVLWAWTTGDAVRAEHDDPEQLRAEHGLRAASRRPCGRSGRSSRRTWAATRSRRYEFFQSGHGKTVLAEATLDAETVRRVLRTTVDDLLELSWAGTHGAVASGMQSVAFTPASAIAAIFACTGQDLGMVGTSSMAHGTAHRTEDGGLHAAIRFPGLEVGTVGGGTTLPYARSWLALLGCAGAGKVTASRRSSRRRRSRSRSPPRRRWRPRARRTSSAPTTSAEACAEAPATR